MKFIIGIDPGAAGGIAVYGEGKADAKPMPETMPDIYEIIKSLVDKLESANAEIVVYMEDVGHGMPGQSSSATAKFARHNGNLEAILYCLGASVRLVTPGKWQKHYSNTLGKSTSCASKNEWKNKLKAEAQRRFPKLKVTLKTADALLIAAYGYDMESKH